MVSLLDWLFPRDVTSPDQPAPASASQEATGKNIQEVRYQEGSKDKITHTESTGFHFIEIHQGTVGTMLILLMVLGIILCCLKAARGHYLRRQHFQRTLERKIRERMARDQSNVEDPPYIWDRDYFTPSRPFPTGQINVRTLHGGRFLTLIYSQEDLHRNLRENIARQTSRLGSRRLSGSGRNSPAHHPLGTAHRRSSTFGRSVPTVRPSSTAASGSPTASNSLHHRPHPPCPSTRYLRGDSETDLPGLSKNSPGRCRHKFHQKICISIILFCFYPTWPNRRPMHLWPNTWAQNS